MSHYSRMIRHAGHAAILCLLLPLASCATTTAPSGESQIMSNRAIVEDAFARWRTGLGGPFDLLAAEATWTIVGTSPLSKTYHGREEFLSDVIRPFNARLSSPLIPTVREIYADGDTVIVVFDAEAGAKDGIRYHNTYSWFLRMNEGQIVRAVAFLDTRAFDEFWTRVTPSP